MFKTKQESTGENLDENGEIEAEPWLSRFVSPHSAIQIIVFSIGAVVYLVF